MAQSAASFPAESSSSTDTELPDAPSTVQSQSQDVVATAKTSFQREGRDPASCNLLRALGPIYFDPSKVDQAHPRCTELLYPYQRFLDTNIPIPLNWKQKGYLAAHFTTDPGSVGIITGISGINIAIDSHTAYGPGWAGFGKLAGVSLLQNATAEFFGTFAVPALVHQDPRYYRMPHRPIGKRILYSVSRSYVSRSDDGRTIPNYGVFATYPIVAELGNLYVPGIQSDGASTAERIATGLALDPVNNLVNEFLPDVAKHIHVRIIFFQQILNNIAASGNGMM
ncbi:hypothetical protein [Edaphobacter albus]|uniref:hypothetical protein n=1 Tax=Edaphobacter sp. 4G125 TaxID=2763071 RepID=UPI001644DE9A|nr:hypothetical protein [Edaphobacter sp. 4G125]QNI37414.1 hypothetical protein H7846_03615 [Edaphobacter sp. 4G125]